MLRQIHICPKYLVPRYAGPSVDEMLVIVADSQGSFDLKIS